MTAQIIDGKALALRARQEISADVATRLKQGLRQPGLAVILVGSDTASEIYVRNKRQASEDVGIKSLFFPLPADTEESELITLIKKLNQDDTVDGILLQLPLPPQMESDRILECIAPHKDVDGFHAYNLGRLAQRRPLLRPCTPLGVMMLLDSVKTSYRNRHAVIVGASNIVGRPMALELLLAGCTITVCHRFTEDLAQYVKQADILVSAVGKPHIIQGAWVKPGATVIDIGINRLPSGKMTGDVEFDVAKERAAWITPVPGGVGPMTVAALLKNTLTAAETHENQGQTPEPKSNSLFYLPNTRTY
jgi:methylenetetrahydrofolate dehydrogenase (NADP+)/methenyltetrahydrofolate cyclohydrolase